MEDSFDKHIEDINYKQYEREVGQRVGEAAIGSFKAEKEDRNSVDEEDSFNIPTNWLLTSEYVFDQESQQNDAAIEDIGEADSRAVETMRKFIGHNLIEAAREYKDLKKRAVTIQLILEVDRRKGKNGNVDVRRIMNGDLNQVNKSLERLSEQTPESYTLVHGLEFREHVREAHAHEMVTTPYVKEHLERVKNDIATGQPVFLHGHLGSGKTELAINAAVAASIQKAAYEEAVQNLRKFRGENPGASEEETREEFNKSYCKSRAFLEKAYREGDPSTEKFRPLIVSGSEDLTTQDLFTDKTLVLSKFNGKPLREHMADLEVFKQEWAHAHPDEASNPEKRQAAEETILELFKLKNAAFGTEVEKIIRPIHQGIKEGRPVIIDEVNAIPSALLISLNDILQRRPGENCYVPGEGQVRIRPGFSLILTGNLSSSTIDYQGTNDLNPAFLSRLDVIEHDYLPMSVDNSNYKEQENPGRNELFHVALAYLADKQGNLRLPEMEKSLDKLFSLCQLARKTQLVFEGKWRESISVATASGDDLVPNLEKSVLSVRNLIRVLDEWDNGTTEDLDTALWKGFVSSIANADDQNFILAIAKTYGFFADSDGWNVEVKPRGASFTSLDEIHPGEFDYKQPPFEVYSVRKIVEVLYGPGPERELYPDFDEIERAMNAVDDDVSAEDYERFRTKLKELNTTISALEVLSEQCGCSISNDGQNNVG